MIGLIAIKTSMWYFVPSDSSLPSRICQNASQHNSKSSDKFVSVSQKFSYVTVFVMTGLINSDSKTNLKRNLRIDKLKQWTLTHSYKSIQECHNVCF